MSTGSPRFSERKKMKGLKVLELFNQGYSYRKIAKLVHLSLRDVSKFINLSADKTKTPSMASFHDFIILEYRVNLLRSEVRDLMLQKENLTNEVNDLRAQKSNLEDQVHAKYSEIEKLIKERVDTILNDKKLIFLITFFALTEALRNHHEIKLLLFDLIMSDGLLSQSDGRSTVKDLENDQIILQYYDKLLPLYDEYLTKVMEIIHGELMRSYSLMRAKQSESDAMKRDLEYERFSNDVPY